jgi:hypothetical protein
MACTEPVFQRDRAAEGLCHIGKESHEAVIHVELLMAVR